MRDTNGVHCITCIVSRVLSHAHIEITEVADTQFCKPIQTIEHCIAKK